MLNILIVEDNAAMRRMIKSIVFDLAEQTFECSDGVEALRCYAVHRPDWVLMDIGMKEVDGISATREIKDSFPEARIVIVSDYDDPKLHDAARRAGASEYVVKESLLEIRRVLLDAARRENVFHQNFLPAEPDASPRASGQTIRRGACGG